MKNILQDNFPENLRLFADDSGMPIPQIEISDLVEIAAYVNKHYKTVIGDTAMNSISIAKFYKAVKAYADNQDKEFVELEKALALVKKNGFEVSKKEKFSSKKIVNQSATKPLKKIIVAKNN